MNLDRGGLLDDFKSVSVHLDVEFKLEFEAALVLAVDGDRALVLPLV